MSTFAAGVSSSQPHVGSTNLLMKYHLLCTWFSGISIVVGYSVSQYRADQDLIIRDLYLEFDQHANLFPRSPVKDSEIVPLDADQLNERKQALLQAKVLSKKSPPSTSGRVHSPLSREDAITEGMFATSSGSPKASRPGSFRFKLPEKTVRILSEPQSPQSPRTPEMGRFKFPENSPPKSFSSSNRKASQGSLYLSPVSSPRLKSQGSLYQSALSTQHKSQGSLYQSVENYQWKAPEGSRRQSIESVQQKNPPSLGSSHHKTSQSLGSSHQGSSQRKPSDTSQSGKSGSPRQKLSKSSQLGRMGSSIHKTSGSSQQTRPQSSRSSHTMHTQHTQKHDLPTKVQCKAGVKPTICERCMKQWSHWTNVIKRKPTMVTTMGAAGGVVVQSIGTGVEHKPTQLVGGAIVAASLGCLGAIQAYEQDLKQTYAEHHPDEINPDPDAEKRKYWEDRNKVPVPHRGSFNALGNMM